MAATTLIRPGAQNLGSDKTENFLVKASDMLLAEFEAKRIMDGMVRKVEVPDNAAAVQIPVTGSIGGGYHVPGDNIIDGTNAGGSKDYLKNLRSGVITIAPDRRLLGGPEMIDLLDQKLNYWSTNAVAVREMARFLANLQDQKELALVTKAATTAANRAYTGELGGNEVILTGTHTGLSTITGAQLIEAVFDMGDAFFGKDVPDEQRHIALPVTEYSKFIKEAAAAGLIADVDLQGGEANASVARGYVKMVNGFMIHKTNHLPTAGLNDNDSDGLGLDNLAAAGGVTMGSHKLDGASGAKINVYNIDSRNLVGVAWQQQALGTAMFQEPKFEAKYFMEYQAELGVSSMVTGSQVLRPSCAGIFRWAAV